MEPEVHSADMISLCWQNWSWRIVRAAGSCLVHSADNLEAQQGSPVPYRSSMAGCPLSTAGLVAVAETKCTRGTVPRKLLAGTQQACSFHMFD